MGWFCSSCSNDSNHGSHKSMNWYYLSGFVPGLVCPYSKKVVPNWVNKLCVLFMLFSTSFNYVYLVIMFKSDQMSQYVIRHLSSVIPEFQLLSEQESCLFLDEIQGGYFLVMCKVDWFYWRSIWTWRFHIIVWKILRSWGWIVHNRVCIGPVFVGFRRVAFMESYCVEGLIYFQIQVNLLHLKDGVVQGLLFFPEGGWGVFLVCILLHIYLMKKILVVLSVESTTHCSPLKAYHVVWWSLRRGSKSFLE